MKQPKHYLYEGMYILSAQLNDDLRTKTFEKIKEAITKRGGEIVKVHDQGKRRLAYDIQNHKEGYYYIMYFNAPSTIIDELWREYRLNEDLVRFMTMRTEKVMEEIKFKQLVEQ